MNSNINPSADNSLIEQVTMPNAMMPKTSTNQPSMEGKAIMSGGQPSAEDIKLLQSNGFSTVINLRPPAEMAGNDEAEQVKALGMNYFQIAVAGPQDFSQENALQLDQLLNQASGNVLVHCLSGNRVGALFALRAFFKESHDLEDSIEIGKAYGLTKAEGMIAQIIANS
jgi:uncharacterized protein (TIGR01244 family)